MTRERTRARSDRGAALTEFALILPLLVMIFAGVVDFGFAWKDSLTIGTGAQAGARIGANLGDDRAADEEALVAIAAAVATLGANVTLEHVIVFKPGPDGEVPATCLSGGAHSVTNLCNHYTPTQLAAALAGTADFSGSSSCAGSALDRFWCPTDREARQLLSPDEIGVYVQAQRGWSTGIFPGNGLTISRTAVMRLEPPT
ncbi:MAG: pilus assembly protein [Actinomycetia bacterium]|nr:pilus assembly protein [Actinomycetes bacterium]